MTQDPFGDIPLFREIQRLLTSGGGPVNLEIAGQVARAVATEGRTEAPPPADRLFSEAVHEAEALVAGYTRLPLVEPIRVQVINRTSWVASTLEAWRWILDRLATRFTAELGRLGAEGEGADPMQAAMGQVAPLLMGIQTGSLLGQLARETLGRYDLPIPRDDDGRLFFVAPNVERVSADYGFDPPTFHRWLALHDTTRHLTATSVSWLGSYHRSLLVEVIDSIEIDTSDIERRLADLQMQGMEALQEGLAPDQLVPVVQSPRHQAALARLRAFLALFEGYARHSAGEVAPRFVEGAAKIDEGMARFTFSPTEGEAMLDALLGISLDRELENAGRTFCAAVTELRGLAELNRVWEAPDNLPVLEEIRDPFAWMERVLGG